MTLCEKLVSIPTEKRHLISSHGDSFALVLEMTKSLSHLFISYNELAVSVHHGFLLNNPALEIALFMSLKRCCSCVLPQDVFFFFFFVRKEIMMEGFFFCSQTEAIPCQGKQVKEKPKGETA